ncbi:Putative penicillin-binding protein activator LpoA [Candidatus Providencia siddallii]|uniref:Putative penicillin-binding protein activator LpoA n=1 Tax=Candidatus Providencia siddallii TaxID=1715285 RepID=A0A0M6W7L1_9GAMM|nr:Putative penicillin-binding protein activator LpoA [Candidatus Providencia siddallii]
MNIILILSTRNKLIYKTMLFVFILSGCQITSNYLFTDKKTSSFYYQTIINAAKNKPSMKAIRAYISQEPLLTTHKKHQENINGLWKMLTTIKRDEINYINKNENILRGWVDLLDIYQNYQYNYKTLRINFENWKKKYSNNPSAKTPPNQLIKAMTSKSKNSIKIALFLPMNGPGEIYSKAIIKGFIDAQKGITQIYSNHTCLNTKQHQNDIILDEIFSNIFAKKPMIYSTLNINSNESILNTNIKQINNQKIKIFDTTSEKLPKLLEQAEKEDFDVIVGPLFKKDVQNITQMNSNIKILALNELNDKSLPDRSNICYFSLSPENEAQNAAIHIKADGKNTPLILIPESELGKRIVKAFNKKWQSIGGSTVFTQTFGSVLSLKQLINKGFGIKLTGIPVNSNKKIHAIQNNILNKQIDAVYIIATSDELTLIRPMIEMTLNSATHPALYASSRSNKAYLNIDYNFEMEGLQFSEIPLLANSTNDIYKQALQKLKSDYSLIRLYAMGVDAWALANNYTKLKSNNKFCINGASGLLSKINNCTIFRQLQWLQFQQGQINKYKQF